MKAYPLRQFTVAGCLLIFAVCLSAKPRARAAGVPLEGTPGQRNAITDVSGVAVGHSTIIRATASSWWEPVQSARA